MDVLTEERIDIRDGERTPCEVYTRVMGYHRQVSAFNIGKRQEHAERVLFHEAAIGRHAKLQEI